ncbi:hypothetical protein V6N12_011224 [Hibiscus sabdariffa]|uniref:Uncharacterized protein n=1 Tax=Hibiscus sabdariffa TaxID=183260 RepID=A0ABR2EME1_9ROSI
MSALVDIWTDELAKLRVKGQTLFSGGAGTGPVAAESGHAAQSQKKSSIELARAFVCSFMPVKSPAVLCSEGSVSMLVECFSP